MVAGVDDENIALADFDALFDHLAGIDIVIAADVAQVNDGGFVDEEIHVERGYVLAGGVKVDLAIQVSTQVVGMGKHLPIGPVWRQALEILQLQRFVGRPGRGGNAKGDRKVDEFHNMISFPMSK